MAPRACQCCGNTQGPFDKVFVGLRRTGRWVFTCHVPVRDAAGKRLPDAKRAEIAAACNKRREDAFASA